MSLHNEDGIAPDSGVTGPRDREEHPHDLAPDAHLEDDPLNQDGPDTDPATDVDTESGHTR